MASSLDVSACDSSADLSPDQLDTSISTDARTTSEPSFMTIDTRTTSEPSIMSIDGIPTSKVSLMSIDQSPMSERSSMHQEAASEATPMSVDQLSSVKSPSVSGNPRYASETVDQPPREDSASSGSVVSPIVSAPAPVAVELYGLPLSLSATDGPVGDKLAEKDQPFNFTPLAPFPGQTEVAAGSRTIKRTIHEVEHPVEDGDASSPKKRVRVGKESAS